MDRLTKRSSDTQHENGICCTHFLGIECDSVGGNCALGCKWEEEAWSKLAEYEDAEEQGLIVRLPCKVGDRVFTFCEEFVSNAECPDDEWLCECKTTISEGKFEIWMLSDLGKYVFLTREEAEQALAEKGEANDEVV